jgi:hypothetical protein
MTPLLASAHSQPPRAKLDDNAELDKFCADLEAAVLETIQAGKMTKDLAICQHGNKVRAEGDGVGRGEGHRRKKGGPGPAAARPSSLPHHDCRAPARPR